MGDERRRDWSERSPYFASVDGRSRPQAKHHAPHVERNTAEILAVLREALPPAGGCALEVGSGTGQQCVAFAEAFPHIAWQPSDPDEIARGSIAAWSAEAGLPNLLAPRALDVTAPDWQQAAAGPYVALLAINVLHITPWTASEGLLRGAGALLAPGGLVFLYGCFSRDGDPVAASNLEFDRSLKHRNPNWGIRDTRDVASLAQVHGIALEQIVPMAANNTAMLLRRRS